VVIVRIGVREDVFARFGGAPNLARDPQRGVQFNLPLLCLDDLGKIILFFL
jgi:hypothetical protein